MQTKLFVFFAFLAFCHVSYCDTAVTAGPVAAAEDVPKILQQVLTTAISTLHGNLEKVFNPNTVLNIVNTVMNNTSFNAQQVQEIVQKSLQMVQENLKTTLDSVQVNLPNIQVSQIGDAAVKTAEILPAAMKNVFSFLETVSHGIANQPATVEPVKSTK